MLANVMTAGAKIEEAQAAAIFVHGRGASAEDILSLAGEMVNLDDTQVAFLAPQAPGNQWYPYSVLAPVQQNEPALSNALQTLADLVAQLEAQGFPPEKVLLLGFSQGASLSLTYAARNARRYGGVVGLSGGLIGPPGIPWNFTGSMRSTPVFLGCSDVDPYIPQERVVESAREFERLGARVDARLYPGMEHTVCEDEILAVREMIKDLIQK